ncbi:MAG: bifunctional diguanylate cyclase/phosphodiesterase [Actinomycetia bacterium]|nr:bifunctional diguanylate cyclase/phosphodiesterase [Actinomycetes bacterium]
MDHAPFISTPSSRPKPWADGPVDEATSLVEAGLRAMRLVGALLLFPYILRYRPGPDDASLPFNEWISAVSLCGSLALANALSIVAARVQLGRIRLVASLFGLLADTIIVLLVVGGFGILDPDLAWFILIIPVLEAGMRFEIRASFYTWAFELLGYVAVTKWAGSAESLFDEFDETLQRVGVVLLVAIPVVYLAQKLLLDIRLERRATGEATRRSRLLETVAQASQRVSRLDAGMVDELLDSVASLGFEAADVCVLGVGGQWRVEASRSNVAGIGLPDPEQAEGGLQKLAEHDRTVILHATQGAAIESALRRHGLSTVLVRALGAHGDATVALRCGKRLGTRVTSTQVECVELLGGNATIALHNKRLVGELRAMQHRLQSQAYHDALTGLSNRMCFNEELEATFDDRQGQAAECAVMFIDLDRFKPVNDSLGHDVGNELLVNVARRLSSAVRDQDLVARMGGDEFVVLLREIYPSTDEGELTDVADRICETISEPFVVADNEVVISCSVGVAISGDDVKSSGELVRRADLAMYRAKGLGKARWELYQPEVDEEGVSRIRIERDLRHAVTNNQVEVAFQGIVSVRSGQFIGAETLLRWQHPVQGLIPPDTLVPIAEDSGLILELGRRVLERACLQAVDWKRRFPDQSPMVAVNVSPVQLFHPRFFDTLDSVLERTGVSPSNLIAEITENIVSAGNDSEKKLQMIRDRGMRLALDDFGKGQTSLMYLSSFPIDILKIDKTFVRNGDSNPKDRAILKSIIDLAHTLGLVVIAEGVETKSQLRLLRDLDCDLVQGYLLHRPNTGPEITQRVASSRNQMVTGRQAALSTG